MFKRSLPKLSRDSRLSESSDEYRTSASRESTDEYKTAGSRASTDEYQTASETEGNMSSKDANNSEDDNYVRTSSKRTRFSPSKRRRRSEVVKEKLSIEDSIKWKKSERKATVYAFKKGMSGTKVSSSIGRKRLQFLKLMINEDVVSLVVKNTNLYFEMYSESEAVGSSSNWKYTDPDEIYRFIGLCLLMSRIKSITEQWSKDWVLVSSVYGKVMSRERYLKIFKMLHFADDRQQPLNDHLYYVRDLMNLFKTSFREAFYPFQDICIFKEAIPDDLSIFYLADAKTKYVLDFNYKYKSQIAVDMQADLGLPGSVACCLMEPFLGKGHNLWMSKWFSSPKLMEYFLKNKVNSCGKINERSPLMPKFSHGLFFGEVETYSSERLLAIKWQTNEPHAILTTIHDGKLVTKRKVFKWPVKIPRCYDIFRQKTFKWKVTRSLRYFEECRRLLPWHQKAFIALIDVAMHNAHIIYNKVTRQRESFKKFKLEAIRQLLAEHAQKRTRGRR